MRRAMPFAVAVLASVVTAVIFSSCHARFISFFGMDDSETLAPTTTAGLARDYRCVRTLLPEWCPAMSTAYPGEIARAANATLASHFRPLSGRVWVLTLARHWTWLVPMGLWLLVMHIVGVLTALMCGRGCGNRYVLRRGGPSARLDRAAVPAMLTAAVVYIAVAPLAAATSWLCTFDIWWPGILDPHEAFPSLLGAALCAALCLVPALGAGWAAARIAALYRIAPDREAKSRRCARCGYEPGRESKDPCPECGSLPGRGCAEWWIRRAAALLVSWPARLAFYALLIGGAAAGMYVWAFGPPSLLPEPNPYLRPKYTILAYALLGAYDAHITWGNGTAPTLIRWPDGTLLYAETVEGFGSADPLRITYATAWLPRGRDRGDSANWRFEKHVETFPAGSPGAGFNVLPEDEASWREWRLVRIYTVYVGDLSQAFVSGRPRAIEKVGPDHRLAAIGDKLLEMIDAADDP